MNQEEINEICEKLGVAPIRDMRIPSEMEFEKMFEDHGCHVYDSVDEQVVSYTNFKLGYVLCEIIKLIE